METERLPISIRLTGVLHNDNNKMYITCVLWSDQNDIVIYRSFKDFKKMHKQMKNAFPSGSKTNKSDRILPKFKSIKMKPKNKKKGPAKSLVRIKYLQKYCNELLSCDPQVSQCAHLIKFLTPSQQDLDPAFTKNSITIMLSEEEIKSSRGHAGGGTGNVTQPFVTETYLCIAAYEVKDTKNKPFKVAANEKVDVLIKDKAGWWLVENEDKRIAWFPAPYLVKVDDEDEDDTNGTLERGLFYTAVKTYNSTKDDEISVNIGVMVEVVEMSDNGWWLVRNRGKVGYIPAMYLQPCSYPRNHMTSQHQNVPVASSFLSPSGNLQQQSQLSRSQGNMLQLPSASCLSPTHSTADRFQRSQSWNVSENSYREPARNSPPATFHAITTTPAIQAPPVIMVEMDGNENDSSRSPASDPDRSFESDSFSDGSNSSEGSSLNLSYGAGDERLQLSRTPPLPPPRKHNLTPTSNVEERLHSSVSDPNIFKGPVLPKVPPRPKEHEILTRCSTITRRKAGTRPPAVSPEIIS